MSLQDGRFPSDLKVTELKVELEKRCLSKTGNKKDLIERLNKFLEEEKRQGEEEQSESENEDVVNSPKQSPEVEESYEISNRPKPINDDEEEKASDVGTEEQTDISADPVPDVEVSKPDTVESAGDADEEVEQPEVKDDEREESEVEAKEEQDGAQEAQQAVEEVEEEMEEEDEAEAEILQGHVSDDEAITGDIETAEATGTSAIEIGGGDEGEIAETPEVTTSTKIEEGDNDELEEGEMRDDEDEAECVKLPGQSSATLAAQRERSASNTSGVTSTRKRQWGIRRPSAKAYVEVPLSSQSLNTLIDVTSTSVNDVQEPSLGEAPLKLRSLEEAGEEGADADSKEPLDSVESVRKDSGRHVVVEDTEDDAMEEGEVPATPLSTDPSVGKLRHRDEMGSTESMEQEDSGRRASESETGAAQGVNTSAILPPLTSPISQEHTSQSKASPTSKAKKRGLRETRAVGYHVENPVRGRPIEDATQPASDTVQIRGLVRPFTLNQLKDLLSRYGALQTFWIDRVKSKSFVQFQSEEEATNCREDLDGCKWPSINPRLLRVDFSSKEELDWMIENGESGRAFPRPTPAVAAAPSRPAPATGDSSQTVAADSTAASLPAEKESRPRDRPADRPRHRERDEQSPTDRKRPRRSPSPSRRGDKDRERERRDGRRQEAAVREWDRDKMRQSESPPRKSKRRSRSRSPAPKADKAKTEATATAGGKEKTGKEKEATAPVPAKEEPARLLDDLFRKTKVLPSIYWLPLSEEQVKVKQREREERAKARQQRPNPYPSAGTKGASGGRSAGQSGRRRSRSRSRRRDWDPRRR